MTPQSPPPPHRSDWGPLARWMFTFLTGFALPILTCVGLMFACIVALRLMTFGSDRPSSFDFNPNSGGSGPAIALIRVEGVIVSGKGGAFDNSGSAYSRTVIEKIEKAKADDDVKAILLAVNSPGGGVVASDEIYHALQGVDKPIVVVMGDLAASGGYYISMAADWIIANPNSLTGSIGVISEFPQADALLEKIGVDFVVVTSGPRKDIGSPYRDMTEAERAYWQKIIDETYEGFVQIVAAGRHLTVDEVKPLADGGVYTGRQALELKLVDQLGYEADAVAKAAELGGITGEPRIIEYDTPADFFDVLTQSMRPQGLLPTAREVMNEVSHPRLSLRWVGQ